MLENKESGIVYFGFSDCPWCQEALPILKQVLEEQKLNCYYVQTRDEERNSSLKRKKKQTSWKRVWTSCRGTKK